MNIFGAIKVIVVTCGALVGSKLASRCLQNYDGEIKLLLILISGFFSGLIALKFIFWLLKILDESSKKKKNAVYENKSEDQISEEDNQ